MFKVISSILEVITGFNYTYLHVLRYWWDSRLTRTLGGFSSIFVLLAGFSRISYISGGSYRIVEVLVGC